MSEMWKSSKNRVGARMTDFSILGQVLFNVFKVFMIVVVPLGFLLGIGGMLFGGWLAKRLNKSEDYASRVSNIILVGGSFLSVLILYLLINGL